LKNAESYSTVKATVATIPAHAEKGALFPAVQNEAIRMQTNVK